jgi:hypothetical protein
MSKFARHVRRRRSAAASVVAFNPDRLSLEDATVAAARAEGCVCDPQLSKIAWPHVTILHDDWCPVMRRQDVN